MEDQVNRITVKAVSPISPHNEALYEVGKKMLADSLEIGREFSKFMITVSSGAIPIYIGLISLFSLKSISSLLYLLPPSMFLIATVLFVFSYFPKHGKYSLDIIDEIELARTRAIVSRNGYLYSGIVIFIFGIILSIGVTAMFRKNSSAKPRHLKVITALLPKNTSSVEAEKTVRIFQDEINHLQGAGAITYQEIELEEGTLLAAFIEADSQ